MLATAQTLLEKFDNLKTLPNVAIHLTVIIHFPYGSRQPFFGFQS